MNTRTLTRRAARFVLAMIVAGLVYAALVVVPELLFRSGWVAVVIASAVLFAIALRPERRPTPRH